MKGGTLHIPGALPRPPQRQRGSLPKPLALQPAAYLVYTVNSRERENKPVLSGLQTGPMGTREPAWAPPTADMPALAEPAATHPDRNECQQRRGFRWLGCLGGSAAAPENRSSDACAPELCSAPHHACQDRPIPSRPYFSEPTWRATFPTSSAQIAGLPARHFSSAAVCASAFPPRNCIPSP